MSTFLIKLTGCAVARHRVAALGLLVLAAAACDGTPGRRTRPAGSAGAAGASDSAARRAADSAAAMAAVHDTTARRLSPAADSIAPYLVFAPAGERQFVAAVRNRRWLLDVGRMDADVRKDSAKARAFREAAPLLSPVVPGAVFRLWWAAGAEDVVADSFAVYNGRIVMQVFGSLALDSVAKTKGAHVAFAVRADSAAAPAATSCELRVAPDSAAREAARAALAALSPGDRKVQAQARRTADSTFDARVALVRDSLDQDLRRTRPPYERLQRRLKGTHSQVRGCFGAARRALVVSLRAGDAEWVQERLVLIAPGGAVTTLRIGNLRFRAHDLLAAFDADGDGVDDLAVKGLTERAGGTTVLRVDLQKKRADRLAGGFAWEIF